MGQLANTSPRRPASRLRQRRAFTLLEMIGVLAILGVLATLMAPNAIKSIDRAAAKAEANLLAGLADSLAAYLVENEALPTVGTWPAALADYAQTSAAGLATNKRQGPRVLVYDPAAAPAERAVFLSSMRSGLALPTAANINTAARFQDIWDTPDGELPTAASWNGWAAWAAVEDSGDYLLVQRVNLKSIYLDELKTCSVALNNTTTLATSYRVRDRAGAQIAAAALAAGASITLDNLAKGDRVLVYATAGYSPLVYSYIAQGDDISFDLSDWIASGP